MRFEIMTRPLGFGSIDHADGSLQKRRTQLASGGRMIAPGQQELGKAHLVKQRFVTALQSGTDPLPLGDPAPVRRRRNSARVSRETNQEGFSGMSLPRELANI